MASHTQDDGSKAEVLRPTSSSTSASNDLSSPQDEIDYPPAHKVVVIMLALFISAFLVALDRTIIGTAIPKITDDFQSLGDVGWYASAYLLTMCGCQLLMGRIYTFFDIKTVFLANIIIFEIGSAICGAAPSSTVFIVGRAIAGIGSAGIFSGAIPIFVYILPLHKRPLYTGLFGMVFGIASVVAPLLGGAFTDKVSWRWCFYINLPIGAVTFVIIVLILKLPEQKHEKLTIVQQLNRLDPIGTAIFFPSIVCLLLALQWGGVNYAWGSGRIIALLVLFGTSFIAFVGVQLWRKDLATVPPRIMKNRNVAAGVLFTFCTGSAMFVMVYFLPIWFQAIKGASAVKSGIMNLPMILGLVVASISAGALTKKIGYYTPWLYVCAVLMPVGAGLISTFTTTTNHSKWIGYQFLFGFGLGVGMQQPSVAVQTVLPRKDVPSGVSLMFFSQSLGGAICSSIANNLFTNKLAQGLVTIPGVDVGAVTNVGATDLRKFVPSGALSAVLEVYNDAVVHAFYVGVALSACAILGALPMQWKSIKKGQNAIGKPKDVEALNKRSEVVEVK